VRQLPGRWAMSIGARESFADGLLDCRSTRARVYQGARVPEELLSGTTEHPALAAEAGAGRTWLRRPDLLAARPLSEEETKLLAEFEKGTGAE